MNWPPFYWEYCFPLGTGAVEGVRARGFYDGSGRQVITDANVTITLTRDEVMELRDRGYNLTPYHSHMGLAGRYYIANVRPDEAEMLAQGYDWRPLMLAVKPVMITARLFTGQTVWLK